MEPWTITTTYPDGKTEQRTATPDEVAQREADIANAEAQRVADEKAEVEREAAAAAAIAHAKSLGFTDDMIAVMYPGLASHEVPI